MEMRIGSGEASAHPNHHHAYYGMMMGSSSTGMRKRNIDWDPNQWRWDGDLFTASPLSNGSSFSSEKRDLEKRRRVIVVEHENDPDDVEEEDEGPGKNLCLKLGGNGAVPCMAKNKSVGNGGGSNRGAVCQVDDCGADLSCAKDYHRRHKVCEMHSKATSGLVAGVLQRFCQQCSRFHVLQEFDEGRRSCRRRLAGHNKRRRKTQPEAVVNNNTLNDDQTSSYLLIKLLRILSNMQSNESNQTSDQDLLSHLLRSLVNQSGVHADKLLSGLLQDSQNLLNNRTFTNSDSVTAVLPNSFPDPSRPDQQNLPVTVSGEDSEAHHIQTAAFPNYSTVIPIKDSPPPSSEARDSSAGRSRMNAFDLNDVYIDSDECTEDLERSPATVDLATSYVQQDSHQSSPPQTSGNSDSGSAQSPSSSSGEAQSRTERIVIKLFGKEPSDFPFVLRTQILDWLSHSPSDIEGYIRPGCVILTIYLRLPVSAWEELCCDLASSLSTLLDNYEDNSFWTNGWIYFRLQQQIALAYNGHIVAETSLPSKNENCSSVLSIKPIAVPISDRAQFVVKGYNLKRPSTRLLCAFEGNYLVEEGSDELLEEHIDGLGGNDNIQCRNLSCSIPVVTGRGFIEVEDDGLGSSFVPFLVAEKDVCSEIRMLERAIECTETDDIHINTTQWEARNQALEFIHEMGWLLHRNHLKTRLGDLNPTDTGAAFTFKRLKWLMEFSMNRDWCAVVRNLLNTLFDGTVDTGELKLAFSEMGLLHKAVRRNSRPLVEFLLRYVPERVSEELISHFNYLAGGEGCFLFKPNVQGPAGLTPLHVAAGTDGTEDVLDALTNDPGKLGLEAWKNTRDGTGFTPEDYARLRGHFSYIHLVQRKINRRSVTGHVVVDIPGQLPDSQVSKKLQIHQPAGSFQISSSSRKEPCRVCAGKLSVYGNTRKFSSLAYRPAMLSMVAIAAVCVCVALIYKTCPEVVYLLHPFRWDMLAFGSS